MLAALEAGAEDIIDHGDTWQVTTATRRPARGARRARGGRGSPVTSTDLTMLPSTTVELDEAAKAKSVLRVIDALEEHDDVQNVYANFDIPDDVLQAVYAVNVDDALAFIRDQHEAVMLDVPRRRLAADVPGGVQRGCRRTDRGQHARDRAEGEEPAA